MSTQNTNVKVIVGFFAYIFLFGFILVDAAIRTLSFKRREGCSIQDIHIISSSVAKSQLECVVSATSSGHITSSWNAAFSMCKMSDVDTTHDEISAWACDWISGWNTFTQKIYPVFSAVGPNGRYSLTYPQAVALCQEYGTTLASPADLLSAKALGLNLCECGWLSDGSMGLVLQTLQTGCLPWNDVGINNCHQEFANAYCLLE